LLRGYTRKGAWTIVDQALFAGSNFVLNFLLIQAVSGDAYGAYAVAFAIFLLFGTLHTGLLTEPMLVFGAGRFSGGFRSYLAILRRGHVFFGFAACAALALAGLVASLFDKTMLSGSLYAASLAQPFILYLWLMRRACYVHLKPKWSAIGGIVYAVVLLAGVVLTARLSLLTVPLVFGLMALGSLVGGVWIALWLRRYLPDDEGDVSKPQVLAEHRRYGGWAVATGVLAWLPSNIPFLILEFAHGSAAPGILKAMLNFIMPAAHAYAALSILLVPVFVRAQSQDRLRSLVMVTAAALVVANVVYWVLIGSFGPDLIRLLYRGKYLEYGGYLWLAGLYPIVSGVAVVVRTALRALERPNFVFWSGVASSVCALTLTLFLIVRFGVAGAIAGISINMVVELTTMFIYFRKSNPAKPAFAAVATSAPER
jgi:O-antigen/teichoic acid export membrane protein